MSTAGQHTGDPRPSPLQSVVRPILCAGCGGEIVHRRSNKRFCSDACRNRTWVDANRQRALDFQPAAQPLPLTYRGETYIPNLDSARLARQLDLVLRCMSDGCWRTLREIEAATGQPQASVSARLRELRHLGATVERRRRGEAKRGIFEYSLVPHGR